MYAEKSFIVLGQCPLLYHLFAGDKKDKIGKSVKSKLSKEACGKKTFYSSNLIRTVKS
jgi:hypothetical protein